MTKLKKIFVLFTAFWLTHQTHSMENDSPPAIPQIPKLTFQNEAKATPDPFLIEHIPIIFSYVCMADEAKEMLQSCSQVCITWYRASRDLKLNPILKYRYLGHLPESYQYCIDQGLNPRPIDLIRLIFINQELDRKHLIKILSPKNFSSSLKGVWKWRFEQNSTAPNWGKFLEILNHYSENSATPWKRGSSIFDQIEGTVSSTNTALFMFKFRYLLQKESLIKNIGVKWCNQFVRFCENDIKTIVDLLIPKKPIQAENLSMKLSLHIRDFYWTVKCPLIYPSPEETNPISLNILCGRLDMPIDFSNEEEYEDSSRSQSDSEGNDSEGTNEEDDYNYGQDAPDYSSDYEDYDYEEEWNS